MCGGARLMAPEKGFCRMSLNKVYDLRFRFIGAFGIRGLRV